MLDFRTASPHVLAIRCSDTFVSSCRNSTPAPETNKLSRRSESELMLGQRDPSRPPVTRLGEGGLRPSPLSPIRELVCAPRRLLAAKQLTEFETAQVRHLSLWSARH